jgi:ssDNA-binding Zn-finger/Zn-ribbon topoisomerase 1
MTWRLANDCPDCGAPLRLRRNRREKNLFVGCSDYPRCRFTEDHDEREGELLDRIQELEAALAGYVARRPTAPAEVVEKELRALIFDWHPHRQHEPLAPHVVVGELTRLQDIVRAAA